jgi:hypothetical protein
MGYGVALGAWLYGILDAAPAARRHNRRVQTAFLERVDVIAWRSRSQTIAGLRVTF